MLDVIREAYTFVDSSDEALVIDILARRPDIAVVLLDALPHDRAVFGDDTQVMLLAVDEQTGAPQRLSARIVTTESVPGPRLERDRLYRTFWLDVPGAVDEVLSPGLMWPRAT